MNNQQYQEKMQNSPWGSLLIHAALLLVLPSAMGLTIWKILTQSISWQMSLGFLVFVIFTGFELWMLRQTYRYMIKVSLGKKIFWSKLGQNLLFWLVIGATTYYLSPLFTN